MPKSTVVPLLSAEVTGVVSYEKDAATGSVFVSMSGPEGNFTQEMSLFCPCLLMYDPRTKNFLSIPQTDLDPALQLVALIKAF